MNKTKKNFLMIFWRVGVKQVDILHTYKYLNKEPTVTLFVLHGRTFEIWNVAFNKSNEMQDFIVFSPDGSTFVSSTNNGMQSWNIESGKKVMRFEGITNIMRKYNFLQMVNILLQVHVLIILNLKNKFKKK
ncbi:WD-40 repeat protein [Reticulomyxa filosa]|uniref:WD-40 repeat protein n=1 Tax=Reticulomyxa filosa TaxID=46433 RepID=X6LEA9_RETFI|nr:WD-40 repeat protein [Reticulomyxa filosa]|eukprot:ETN99720.1 WD-40 repeat protein [Reticulomyxa filosa]